MKKLYNVVDEDNIHLNNCPLTMENAETLKRDFNEMGVLDLRIEEDIQLGV